MTDSPDQMQTDQRNADPFRDAILECAGVSVERGGRRILHDVNLRLVPHECVSLVGPNGSGKTTLVRTLLGLVPPTVGHVRLDGEDTHRIAPHRRARWAAYVPQRLDASPVLTVVDVVTTGRFPHGHPLRPLSAADQSAVGRAMDTCGVTALADRAFNTLSGGERQKVLIAAAMAQAARFLFLDEPNTALDPAYQIELVRILRDWHHAGGGLLVISHDLHLPVALGGRVLALRDGRVAADGPAAEVLTPATLARIYGAPFAVAATPAGPSLLLPAWWLGG